MVARARRLANRRGKGKLGCVLWLAIFGAGIYYGIDAGASYIRYYRMLDEMKVQARFATNLDDDTIRRRLRQKIQELSLPEEARRISIRRRGRPREVIITTTWQDTLNLPFRQLILTRKPEAREAL